MKKSIFLLVVIAGIFAASAFADQAATADSEFEAKTEAVSVDREAGCKTGFCPAPVDTQQASLVDRGRAKQLVDWIMNDGKGAPPEITNSETHK
jgi:hypothetical protein